VRLGSREVTLIGGEAYLRGDCMRLIEHLVKAGVRVTMQTGGRGLTADRVRRLREAGLSAVGVSVDGPEQVHERLLEDTFGIGPNTFFQLSSTSRRSCWYCW